MSSRVDRYAKIRPAVFAVVEAGGKQYRVEVGQVLDLERMDLDPGEEVELPVLAFGDEKGELEVGSPYLSRRARVVVLLHGRGPKIRGFKYKSKTNYRRRWGHRQPFTRVRVLSLG